jgi:hypothetical protein
MTEKRKPGRPAKPKVHLSHSGTKATPGPLDIAAERLALDAVYVRSRQILESTLSKIESGEIPVSASLIESVLKGIKTAGSLLDDLQKAQTERERAARAAAYVKQELPFAPAAKPSRPASKTAGDSSDDRDFQFPTFPSRTAAPPPPDPELPAYITGPLLNPTIEGGK